MLDFILGSFVHRRASSYKLLPILDDVLTMKLGFSKEEYVAQEV